MTFAFAAIAAAMLGVGLYSHVGATLAGVAGGWSLFVAWALLLVRGGVKRELPIRDDGPALRVINKNGTVECPATPRPNGYRPGE